LSGYEINSTQTVKVVGNIWQLPSYKWLFNIELELITTPKFDFDISQFNLDPAILEWKTTNISTSLFMTPWLVIWVIVLIIILLFLSLRKKKSQIVYVKQPTPNIQ
jgi:hypothetical protein